MSYGTKLDTVEVDIIRDINRFYLNDRNNCALEDDISLMIANEINSTNIYDSVYKLLTIIRHSYRDFHYAIGNKYYDVFKFIDPIIDYKMMYQMILCDNYCEIVKFAQNDYDHKKYVSRFSLIDQHIYSFYSGHIMVIETKEGRSEEEYIRLD